MPRLYTSRANGSSPRTRRYFLPSLRMQMKQTLFSAHAEVFPTRRASSTWRSALLRARGGISNVSWLQMERNVSSPRTRRYFPHHAAAGGHVELFSAHAEVFPCVVPPWNVGWALLRARGGISSPYGGSQTTESSSPRTRRYFRAVVWPHSLSLLFSAHAEVFPPASPPPKTGQSLLRARGGISCRDSDPERKKISSPRTRRYFRPCPGKHSRGSLFSAHAEVFPARRAWRSTSALFSAHAEVFPSSSARCTATRSLLRARGGISGSHGEMARPRGSSPRTRRYFRCLLDP